MQQMNAQRQATVMAVLLLSIILQGTHNPDRYCLHNYNHIYVYVT